MSLAMFNVGPVELLIMAAAAVMLFGGDLPTTARKAARAVGRLRALASELGREFSAEEQLPKRSDFNMDLKRLTNLDDDMQDKAPSLPGRREDEPIEEAAESTDVDDGGADEEEEEEEQTPAWRKSLGSELPADAGDAREDPDSTPGAGNSEEATEAADEDRGNP